MALSTQPYKGARDFYPEDKRLQKYMFSVLRTVVERYGYEEYDAPILESLELYLAKSGEEIVNEQTYTFEDRGGRKIAIRPEMTPTVSRMVAARRQELAYPLRWYSIPNLWRYERPQRGRMREHWQLNVDIFGVKDSSAELEVITLVDAIFKAYGASSSMYTVHINSRQLVDYLLTEYLSLNQTTAHSVGKLIDRMHKLERSVFIAQVDEVLSSSQREQGVNERLLAILDAKQPTDLPEEAQHQPAFSELKLVLAQLSESGIDNIRFDISLMRGFDYYTGIIFEVFDADPENNRSMMGGGRYDGLVGLFGVEPVPTVGFGWGDVTLANFLESHHLLPALPPETELYAVLIGDVQAEAQKPIAALREAGLSIAVDLTGRKAGDQLKIATKKNIPFALLIGETEVTAGEYQLKNLQTGEQIAGNTDQIVQAVTEYREKA